MRSRAASPSMTRPRTGSRTSLSAGRYQHVHAAGPHVDPQRAGGDAVEDEKPADLMHRGAHRPEVVVGQNMPEDVSTCGANTTSGRPSRIRDHFIDGRRRERRLVLVADATGLQHERYGRDVPCLENLRPAVAEPAIANHEASLAGRELRATASMANVPLPGTTTAEAP